MFFAITVQETILSQLKMFPENKSLYIIGSKHAASDRWVRNKNSLLFISDQQTNCYIDLQYSIMIILIDLLFLTEVCHWRAIAIKDHKLRSRVIIKCADPLCQSDSHVTAIKPCLVIGQLNWLKGKPLGSIAFTRTQQPRFYWSCSSVVMNDATPLTPPSAWAELHF